MIVSILPCSARFFLFSWLLCSLPVFLAPSLHADEINVSRAGVPCGLVSIPQRNMHTPAEICDLMDIENVARLLAAFIREVGA